MAAAPLGGSKLLACGNGGRAAVAALGTGSGVTARIQEAHGFLLHAVSEATEPDLVTNQRPVR